MSKPIDIAAARRTVEGRYRDLESMHAEFVANFHGDDHDREAVARVGTRLAGERAEILAALDRLEELEREAAELRVSLSLAHGPASVAWESHATASAVAREALTGLRRVTAERDAAIKGRDEARDQRDRLTSQAESALEAGDRDLLAARAEVTRLRKTLEAVEQRAHLYPTVGWFVEPLRWIHTALSATPAPAPALDVEAIRRASLEEAAKWIEQQADNSQIIRNHDEGERAIGQRAAYLKAAKHIRALAAPTKGGEKP